MKNHKTLLTLTSAFLFMLLFVGCGGSSVQLDSSDQSNPAASNPATNSQSASNSPTTSNPTTHSMGMAINDTGIILAGGAGGGFVACSSITLKQDCHDGRDAQAMKGRLAKVGKGGHAGFDFAKLGVNGNALAIQDAAWSNTGNEIEGTKWSCVKDNHTGLIWEVKTLDGVRAQEDEYGWYNSDGLTNGGFAGSLSESVTTCEGYNRTDPKTYCHTQAFVARINLQRLCGANDWRMPTFKELTSIVDYSRVNPSIDTDYFPNTLSRRYWVSSSHAQESRVASLYFSEGYGVYLDKVNDKSFVRLVRDGR